jgi:hypothetical protein
VTRLTALSLSLGVALAVLPAPANAATLEANRSCYGNANLATLSGSGFAPDSSITFTVNDRELEQTVTSSPDGDVVVRYDPARTRVQRKLVIRATDSQGESARTRIFVSPRRRVTARPDSSPNVRTWKAVLTLFGFGDGRAFIHYVNPNGVHKKTVRLGRLRGPCGKLKTDKRRVMPFDNPQFGVWRLQFDTRRQYDKDTAPKRVIRVTVYRG